MNILLINTSERAGGAAIACSRLMNSLQETSHISNTLVLNLQENATHYHTVSTKKSNQFYYYLEKAHFLFYEKNKDIRFQFSTLKFGYDISQHPLVLEADIIHLHWFNQGYLSFKSLEKLLALNKPIVWTLHDMWAFTGGCHYSGECKNYINECGNCKYLKNPGSSDLSHLIWKKKKHLKNYNAINFVTCSKWLAKIAQSSSLLKNSFIQSIPNPIDTNLYKPSDNNNGNKIYLLFQSMNINDERKGLKYLIEALNILLSTDPHLVDRFTLLIFGKGAEELRMDKRLKVKHMGLVRNEQTIIAMYQKSNLFIIPSLEDNLPNTVMEALACGTPVVGFNSGGIPEMIDHKSNGYVATRKDPVDLARGIKWCIEDINRYNYLANAARRKVVQEYSNAIISSKYIHLYRSLLSELP